MSSPLSHLRYHKFKQFSRHIESALHLWKGIGTTFHYLLHYHCFTDERSTLLNSIKEIGPTNLTKNDSCITNILRFNNRCLLQK